MQLLIFRTDTVQLMTERTQNINTDRHTFLQTKADTEFLTASIHDNSKAVYGFIMCVVHWSPWSQRVHTSELIGSFPQVGIFWWSGIAKISEGKLATKTYENIQMQIILLFITVAYNTV
jgi:hypothetical protein